MSVTALKPKPDEEIVVLLREALARAESGDTQAIFLLEVNAETQVRNTNRIGRRDTIIYALEYAKFSTLNEVCR